MHAAVQAHHRADIKPEPERPPETPPTAAEHTPKKNKRGRPKKEAKKDMKKEANKEVKEEPLPHAEAPPILEASTPASKSSAKRTKQDTALLRTATLDKLAAAKEAPKAQLTVAQRGKTALPVMTRRGRGGAARA